jgi:hypothetical protein
MKRTGKKGGTRREETLTGVISQHWCKVCSKPPSVEDLKTDLSILINF